VSTQAHPLRAAAAAEALGVTPEELRVEVGGALAEDLGAGDWTTKWTVAAGARARGTFVSQQELVVAGLAVAAAVFRELDTSVRFEDVVEDGAMLKAGAAMAEVHGPAAALLGGERVALNFLQHLGGIATLTRRFKDQLSGLKAELLDTRKTTPGLRALEKYAVRMGGGKNHRLRLDDGVLIKNNHLRLAGGVKAAVERARASRPESSGLEIEVEVANAEELEEAISAGADRVLLDNMTPGMVKQCVALVRQLTDRARLEVSGGVTLSNIRAYAEAGVDFISVGALTHSAPATAIHFLIEPEDASARPPSAGARRSRKTGRAK
jgi:nicotinate-nucleotide pyrophosphorylase (carboxylating)